jgi:hypothetical protein
VAPVLYSVLCVVVAELAFVIGYLLAFVAYSTVYLGLEFVRVVPTTVGGAYAGVAGVVCGASAGFAAISVAFLFRNLSWVTGSSLIVLSMVWPALGLYSYLEATFRLWAVARPKKFPLYGRFHAAGMAPPIRMYFETTKHVLQHTYPEQVSAEGNPLEVHAVKEAHRLGLIMTLFSMLGAIVGVFLACYILGRA